MYTVFFIGGHMFRILFLILIALSGTHALAESYTMAYGKASTNITVGFYAGRDVILTLSAHSKHGMNSAEYGEVKTHLEKRAKVHLSALTDVAGCSNINRAAIFDQETANLRLAFTNPLRLQLTCSVSGRRLPP